MADDTPLLAIPCVDACGQSIVAKFPLTIAELERILAAKNWILSVITPPGQTMVCAVLCESCAKRVHPPEVLAEMKRRRDERVS